MRSRLRTALPNLAPDRNSGTPLYRQIYESHRRAILNGQLREGAQLPSTRELAADLGVSRNTVLNAFDQLLAEGYIRGERGAGTFVAAGLVFGEGCGSTSNRGQALSKDILSRETLRISSTLQLPASSPPIPFRRGLPAIDRFPLTGWSQIVARCTHKTTSAHLNYTEPQGLLAFRSTIAEYLRNFRAVRCKPEQVFAVSGSQQALQLIAHTLINEKDSVWMEDPGYPGARSAFSAVGADLLPIPVDDEGMNVDRAIALQHMPKLIYVTPSHQFPLGVTMSLKRRLALLDWARQSGACVVEDDYDSEFRFVGPPLSSLQGLSPDHVVYVGTFSKAMFPSLRLGYLVVPLSLVSAFSDSRRANDFCAPFLTQAAMNDFITEGHFARHLRRMRALYAERQSAMLVALRREFGDLLRISNIETGMDLVAWLPASVLDTEASDVASKHGVITMPMSVFYCTPPKRGGLFLGFGAISKTQINQGATKLRRAIQPLIARAQNSDRSDDCERGWL